MRVYRLAVLVAIVLLATPELNCYPSGAFLYDVSQTWGWPKPTDKNKRIFIVRFGEYSKVMTYKSTIKMPTKITCIKFEDNRQSAAVIWISDAPPCYETTVVITSQEHKGFSFWMIVYYEAK